MALAEIYCVHCENRLERFNDECPFCGEPLDCEGVDVCDWCGKHFEEGEVRVDVGMNFVMVGCFVNGQRHRSVCKYHARCAESENHRNIALTIRERRRRS